MAPLQYGLNFTKKANSSGPTSSTKPAPAKGRTIFDDDFNDNNIDSTNTNLQSTQKGNVQEITTFDDSTPSADTKSSKSAPLSTIKSKKAPPLSSRPLDLASRLSQNKQSSEATSLDPSIYDYDAAYDLQHAAEKKRKETIRENAGERKAKHITDLLAAAEVRKRDLTRARDRLVQKEREAEGDEFKEKEAFVTEAYKAQQEETHRLQEEEKARAEREDKLRKNGMGINSFYKNIMADGDRRRQELLQNMENVTKDISKQPSSINKDGEDDTTAAPSRDDSQAKLAYELREQGKDVILTDDGQVADKRQLLSAGLNVAPKKHSGNDDGLLASKQRFSQSASQDRAAAFRGSGSHRDAQRAQRERQSRMLEEQLEQATKRAAEQEEDERLQTKRAAKSRKTGTEISSAKERYLQRKREAALAAKGGGAGV